VKARYVLGILTIIVFVVWGATAFFKTTVQYVSIREAAASRRVVQVMGRIDIDRVRYDVENTRLLFDVYDPEADDRLSADRLSVVYYGVVPGNFEQATSVVLKGKPGEGGLFVAEQILVKCPSKYQGGEKPGYQDIRKHDTAAGAPGPT
jgi:cytochrome c-type biogenesis protein CcmE